MKKIYESPLLEVMTMDTESLLDASLSIIDSDANSPAMSRQDEFLDELLNPFTNKTFPF